MKDFLRYFLPIYLVAFFVLGFFWRSYLTWKRTRVNPYQLGKTDSAHDFIGILFRLVILVYVACVAIYSLWDAGYQYLTPIRWLESPLLIWLGLFLLAASFVWVLIAQAQMGASWRIGIDEKTETPLVKGGLFRFSRNPIFLGMRLMLLGFFLVLPNAVLLAMLVLGDALMQIQVRLEEEFLSRMHGVAYDDYRRNTRRWI